MARNQIAQGFTLIELMVTVIIIGILASIAYPAYVSQIERTRRMDGKAALMNLATHMEHYFTENNSYAGASTPAAVAQPATSPEGYYTLSISNLSATTYTLSAAPTGAQANDACGTFTLSHTMVKGAAESDCWSR